MGDHNVLNVDDPMLRAVGLAVLAMVAVLAVVLVLRSRARRRERARALAMLADAGPLAPGRVCVRDRLRGGGTIASLAGGGGVRDHADGAVWLECADGARVVLGADSRVVAGSRTRRSLVGVPAGTPPALAPGRGRWTLRTVGDGDLVVACGIAARIDARSAGYRDDVAVWRLDGDPVELAAVPAGADPGASPVVGRDVELAPRAAPAYLVPNSRSPASPRPGTM